MRLRAVTRHYLGRCHLERGRLDFARKLLEEALQLDREGEYPAGIAADLEQLAAVRRPQGRRPEAFVLSEKAFNLYVYLRDARRAESSLASLSGTTRAPEPERGSDRRPLPVRLTSRGAPGQRRRQKQARHLQTTRWGARRPPSSGRRRACPRPRPAWGVSK